MPADGRELTMQEAYDKPHQNILALGRDVMRGTRGLTDRLARRLQDAWGLRCDDRESLDSDDEAEWPSPAGVAGG
jgi:hypothetical protein